MHVRGVYASVVEVRQIVDVGQDVAAVLGVAADWVPSKIHKPQLCELAEVHDVLLEHVDAVVACCAHRGSNIITVGSIKGASSPM